MDTETDSPDAAIRLGSAVFRVQVTDRGIKRLVLPPLEKAKKGRRMSIVDISINRRLGPEESRWIADAAAYLEAMFQGKHPAVSTCIELEGQTVFTRRVLDAAMEIPWGETRSYSWVARRIGKPGAARAVGQALGRNPVPLMIPCHRVIKKDGSLGGFGQGTDWKEYLLEIERGGKGL